DLTPAHLEGAEPTGLDRSRTTPNLVLLKQRAGVDRQVSEVAGVPEDDRLHDTVVHVGPADVRQRQADDIDILTPGLAHGLGRTGDRRGGDVHHEFDLWVDLEQRLRLGEGLFACV